MEYLVELPVTGTQSIYVTADTPEEAKELAAERAEWSGRTDHSKNALELWQTDEDSDMSAWNVTEEG